MDQSLVVRNMSMTFGGQRALDEVSMSIRRGEVHGLIGQNGCGKSTLIKILAGYHHPDPGGEVEIDGQPVKLPVPAATAAKLGMSFVHQDLGLLPTLTVLENFRAGAFSTESIWFINWKKERRRASDVFGRFEMSLNPRAKVVDLPALQRAQLAIVRALDNLAEYQAATGGHGGLLVLDEPTVFLPRANRERFFEVVHKSVTLGASVMFVSHDLDEALAVTDRITVLRDGRVVGTVVSGETSKEKLVEMIIGRRLESYQAARHEHSANDGQASVADLTGGSVEDVSFNVYQGEVLGLTGLEGSGFEEIPYLLFGSPPGKQGRLTVAGREYDLASMCPPTAIKAGMALVPADRQGSAGVGSLLVRDNVMLQVIGKYRPYRLDRRRYLRDSHTALNEYDVRPPQPMMDFQALSGGNQQKVVLAKWLLGTPKLLLVHEPTQGVDVGARAQLFDIITRAAEGGMSVVCATSDYEQLAGICSRVLVFRNGEIACQLLGEQITKDRVMEACYLGDAQPCPEGEG